MTKQKWKEENKWKLFSQGMDKAMEIIDRAKHPKLWAEKDKQGIEDFLRGLGIDTDNLRK